MIVDEMHNEHPELLKDQFWDEVVPKELIYNQGASHLRREEPKGSAENFKVKDTDALYANIVNSAMNSNNLRHRGKQNQDEMYADYVRRHFEFNNLTFYKIT